MQEIKVVYTLKNPLNEIKIIGPNNSIINMIEEVIGYEIVIKQSDVLIDTSNKVNIVLLITIISVLEKLIDNNISITPRDVISIAQSVESDNVEALLELYLHKEHLVVLNNGKPIYPKSINQKLYIQALENNDIIFGVGPAGTGKTYLAVLYAVSQLKKNNIKKIILVRPVVEAGERLGFLPGDLKEKIDPYLIPLYDALNDCFGKDTVSKLVEKGVIEVAPLAYMRGRTLDNAIIILDEAQNATILQTKMFLTRLGFNSKMIITGDITQIDLPVKQSGLSHAINILQGIRGIDIVYFQKHDVMRHPLVFKIVNRYEEFSNEN
ncbi:MAG: PhoH family protein [Bacilli bacterium]